MTSKNYDRQIVALEEHARIANLEMGIIKTDIAWIRKAIDDHIRDETADIKELSKKISEMRMGVPPWISIILTIFTGLVVYFLTH